MSGDIKLTPLVRLLKNSFSKYLNIQIIMRVEYDTFQPVSQINTLFGQVHPTVTITSYITQGFMYMEENEVIALETKVTTLHTVSCFQNRLVAYNIFIVSSNNNRPKI